MALVACRFRDKRHDQAFIEDYVDVSRGSGQALLDALSMFAERSGHGEVAQAPLLMWGQDGGLRSVAAASGFVGNLTNGSFEPAAGPENRVCRTRGS